MAFDTSDFQNQRFFPANVEDKLVGLIGRCTGMCVLALVALVWVSLATWTARDPSLTMATSGPVQNAMGAPGAIIADLMLQMLGFAAVTVLLAPMVWSVELIRNRHVHAFRSKIAFYPLSVLIFAGALSALPASASWPIEHGYGGILGDFVFGLISSTFAVLNPARAGLATGILLTAIGLSCLMHSLGLELRDLYRIIFQPLREVNWREKADSWQNSLLSEAKRLREGVRETFDQTAPLADIDDARPSPSIILPETDNSTERSTESERRHDTHDTYQPASPQRHAASSAPQTGPNNPTPNWHPQAHRTSHAGTNSGAHPALNRDTRYASPVAAGLNPLPPHPLRDHQSAPKQPASHSANGRPVPSTVPQLPPTTPHPVSNPFDKAATATAANPAQVSTSQPVQRFAQQPSKNGYVAGRTMTAPVPSTPQQKTPQTIAQRFAHHVASQSHDTDDPFSDDDAEASRAMALRFAPRHTGSPDTELELAAPPGPPMPIQNVVEQGDAVPAFLQAKTPAKNNTRFVFPSTQLLAKPDRRTATPQQSPDQLRQNADALQTVLSDFGVKGTVKNIRPGPVVTLYEFEPARGTKSSRVVGLADDIARSMSAVSARVAVVPGQNALGIELPNSQRLPVLLRELVDTNAYRSSGAALPLALGKAIGGEPVVADLARMPHLLVAGTTGSGKSVGINTMVLSILFKHTPKTCRLLMIDPKMLELSVYNDIPHLLSPVITDPNKAVFALNWAVREMEERYKRMSKLSVRNIGVYNNRVRNAKKTGETLSRTVHTGFDKAGKATYESEEMAFDELPHIVIVVDEFADLMLVAGKEIEAAIQRLAQMARAAGIHLIMATQRPSVDVITGTIKANFPTRISFKVTSKVDSRTILNEQGAEQLLGQGDMLYAASSGQTVRVHGPFVSDEEVESIANHLKAQGAPAYISDVTEEPEGASSATTARSSGSSDGDLYDRAVALVVGDRKASTSYVQRRLSIGYNRAADLIERMEDNGVIGPAGNGGKREILAPAPSTTESQYTDA